MGREGFILLMQRDRRTMKSSAFRDLLFGESRQLLCRQSLDLPLAEVIKGGRFETRD